MSIVKANSPGCANIGAYAGDTFELELTFLEDDGTTPVNLTGVDFKMCIKAALTPGGTALETFVTPTEITLSGGGNNILTISKILNIPGGDYFYDLEATYPDDTVLTFLKGEFLVDQDITNSDIEL